MSSSLTLPPGVTPSKVAALMMRLRRVSGPRGAGAKTAGTAALGAVGGTGLPWPTGATPAHWRHARRSAVAASDGLTGGALTPQFQVGSCFSAGPPPAGLRTGLRMVSAAPPPPAAQRGPAMRKGGRAPPA